MNQLSNVALQRYCDNCGRPFVLPTAALHKRFCSVECRDRWHYVNITRPKRALKQKENTNDLDR